MTNCELRDKNPRRRFFDRDRRRRASRRWPLRVGAVLVWVVASGAGCAEFVHMGQVSDQLNSSVIAGVRVEQQQADGTWKKLGETDGKGKLWILREKVKGGGNVRLSKAGYYPTTLTENKFLQESNLLMIPSDGGDDFSPFGATVR